MDKEFRNQVVIVTGASRGIGGATAIAFARQGAHVIINYRRDLEGAMGTLETIRVEGNQATVVQADLGAPDQLADMVDRAEGEIGPVHVLVNNAAAINRQPFLDVPLDELDAQLAANVRGVFYLSQLVARHMVERRRGAIINVSSILAEQTIKNRTVYSAAKGALNSLTRAMAMDLIPYNVRVNAVVPGPFRTEALLAGVPDPGLQAELQRHIPYGRFGEPMELAQVIVFLASQASSYMTGALIPVDGGLSSKEAGPAA